MYVHAQRIERTVERASERASERAERRTYGELALRVDERERPLSTADEAPQLAADVSRCTRRPRHDLSLHAARHVLARNVAVPVLQTHPR